MCRLLLTLVLLIAGSARAADSPPLAAIDAAWDAGKVEVGTKLTHTYVLENRGPKPLALTVRPACGCTTTEFDHSIPAGGSGKVTAALDTTQMHGRITKTVTVTTDDA